MSSVIIQAELLHDISTAGQDFSPDSETLFGAKRAAHYSLSQ